MARLSSGLKINSAADDAAGLSISNGLRGQAKGLEVSINNYQTELTEAQIAEKDGNAVGNEIGKAVARDEDTSYYLYDAVRALEQSDELKARIQNEYNDLMKQYQTGNSAQNNSDRSGLESNSELRGNLGIGVSESQVEQVKAAATEQILSLTEKIETTKNRFSELIKVENKSETIEDAQRALEEVRSKMTKHPAQEHVYQAAAIPELYTSLLRG